MEGNFEYFFKVRRDNSFSTWYLVLKIKQFYCYHVYIYSIKFWFSTSSFPFRWVQSIVVWWRNEFEGKWGRWSMYTGPSALMKFAGRYSLDYFCFSDLTLTD